MCTLVILRRPGHEWPVLVATNRDELLKRPWLTPARHWEDRPSILGGLDLEAGGSWLGINDYGVLAGILNRTGSLGPQPNKRSRGELVLEALDHADSSSAAEALSALNGAAYRPFNMIIADNRDAFWLAHRDDLSSDAIQVQPIPPGLSMITAWDINDKRSPRIRTYLPFFRRATEPNPESDDWQSWKKLLASPVFRPVDGPTEAMRICTDTGFGTTSSSLIGLPSLEAIGMPAIWHFATGYPKPSPYSPIVFS